MKNIKLNCNNCHKHIKSIVGSYWLFPLIDSRSLKEIKRLNHNEKINDLEKFKLDNKNYYFINGHDKIFHYACYFKTRLTHG